MRTLALLLAAGCAEPFGVQREVLGPFRIAALGVVDGEAQAAVWSGQPFADAPVQLDWHLDGTPLGEGWGLSVPRSAVGQTLSLAATAPDGTQRVASVTVGEAPGPFGVYRQPVDLGEAWSLEDRLAAEPLAEDADVVEEGLAVRLVPEIATTATARFMLPKGQGTLLALTDTTSDLLPEDLRFADGELVSRTALQPALATALVLSLDGRGGNRWQWVQVSLGMPLGDRVQHEGFLVAVEGADASTGLLAVTLVALDSETGEITFADPVPVTDTHTQAALECGPAPFRLAWLWEGRCLREDVVGQRVVLEVW